MPVLKKKHFWIGVGVGFVIALVIVGIGQGLMIRPNRFSQTWDLLINPHVPIRFKVRELLDPFNTLSRRELRERRVKNWVKRFPWKRTNDAEVKIDFGVLNDEPNRVNLMNGLRQLRRQLYRGLIENHYMLKLFFEDGARFSLQFESFHFIMNQHDRGHDPAQMARSFHAFRRLWHSAMEHDPNDYCMKNGRKIRQGLFGFETWGDRAQQDYDELRMALINWKWLRPRFQTPAGNAEAHGLIGRLLRQMRGMEELPIDVMKYDVEGEYDFEDERETEILVSYDEWFERAREHCFEEHLRFDLDDVLTHLSSNSSHQNHDELLKHRQDFLNSKLKIEENRIVDEDGKPMKPLEGMNLHLLTRDRGKIPLKLDDEGYLMIPSPEEIDAMRELSQLELEELDH